MFQTRFKIRMTQSGNYLTLTVFVEHPLALPGYAYHGDKLIRKIGDILCKSMFIKYPQSINI